MNETNPDKLNEEELKADALIFINKISLRWLRREIDTDEALKEILQTIENTYEKVTIWSSLSENDAKAIIDGICQTEGTPDVEDYEWYDFFLIKREIEHYLDGTNPDESLDTYEIKNWLINSYSEFFPNEETVEYMISKVTGKDVK